ncbi:MAG: fibrobacter succinogenes major paralogous domain-containing protein [Bacteroidetes bacterium]|nr:fibrobacter succinogenes major paralogous domain-containing protein [Bacteroidota bacterium]
MKKLTILSILILSGSISFSQTKWMVTNKKSGAADSIKVSDIQNIVFRTGESAVSNTVTDIDGNIYHTVKIGTQEWTVENLRTTRYNDGTYISNVTSNSTWTTTTTEAFCYYENNVSTAPMYGCLYNWYSVNTGKLAPVTGGWRVPTDADWSTLATFLGGASIAGAPLKSKMGWSAGGNGTDDFGFFALPAGARIHTNGSFAYLSQYANWWSSTSMDTETAWDRFTSFEDSVLTRGNGSKKLGLSIRLVRDL